MKTAFITIGEAPRLDLAATFDTYFPEKMDVTQFGLLNGLTFAQAAEKLGAVPPEETVISTFCDGTALEMSHAKVEAAMQQKITELEKLGFQLIVVLCTAEFTHLTTEFAELIEPEKVLLPYIQQKFNEQTIGIMVPLEAQIQHTRLKWQGSQLSTHFAAASPYHFTENQFQTAGTLLKNKQVDCIILDCMGYNQAMQQFLLNWTGLPVYPSNALLFEYVQAKILNAE